jgi:hypothetical protein
MKKLLILVVATFVLSACEKSKEQLDLKQALTAKMLNDSDLKDYKIDPADMAECVYKEIAENAPGIPGDAKRPRYFEAYTKFVSVTSPSDAEKAITDYQDVFGDAKATRQAATSVTDHIMSCMSSAIDARAAQ